MGVLEMASMKETVGIDVGRGIDGYRWLLSSAWVNSWLVYRKPLGIVWLSAFFIMYIFDLYIFGYFIA